MHFKLLTKISISTYNYYKIFEKLFTIIDIETTGNSSRNGKITEIAIYQHNGQEITGSFTTLINPEMDIPYFITKLTGIDNEMVRNAPSSMK